ncbi:MAG: thiol:disulfide interchange protein DsbA/DsbL [Thiotrichales bacterium]|nr:thiol:disulfide interchange protein DsbA/DsbL [Thiotrichales bacterium]
MLRRDFLTTLLGASALGLSSQAWSAQPSKFLEGINYQKLPKPVSIEPYKKKVVEVFFYGCPHCYHLEPSLNQWLKTKPKDVHFERMPAVLDNPNWVFMARVFYTAKALGILDKFHEAYFDAIQRDGKRIFDIETLANYCEQFGVKHDDYVQMFKSFKVDQMVQKARILTEEYGVDGVPAVIVNGKFRTDVPMAEGKPQLWQLVNELTHK